MHVIKEQDFTFRVASSRFGLQLELDARYLGGLCELEGEETTDDGWWQHLAVVMTRCAFWCTAEGDDRFGQSNS
jgi:hypothetical protein